MKKSEKSDIPAGGGASMRSEKDGSQLTDLSKEHKHYVHPNSNNSTDAGNINVAADTTDNKEKSGGSSNNNNSNINSARSSFLMDPSKMRRSTQVRDDTEEIALKKIDAIIHKRNKFLEEGLSEEGQALLKSLHGNANIRKRDI